MGLVCDTVQKISCAVESGESPELFADVAPGETVCCSASQRNDSVWAASLKQNYLEVVNCANCLGQHLLFGQTQGEGRDFLHTCTHPIQSLNKLFQEERNGFI